MTKIKLFIAVFISLTCFAVVNSNWSYDSLNKIPQLTLSDLIDSNKGKTFSFYGAVKSIFKGKNDHHKLKINSSDGSFVIGSTIWPSIGGYPTLFRGTLIGITGVLDKYKGSWQLNPLSSEHIEPVVKTPKVDLTDLSKALKLDGKDLYIGPVIAQQYKIIKSKSGKRHLHIFVHNGKDYAKGIIYEGKWDNRTIQLFKQRQQVYIDAKVTEFRGDISLETKDVIKVDDGNKISSLGSIATSLSNAVNKIDEILIVGPVFPVDAKLFTSNKGKQHLRFTVKKNDLSVSGIMWQGIWNDRILDMFDTEKSIYLKTKISTYQNEPSLQAEWVFIE